MSKRIKTPYKEVEVELKDWISGEEGEEIDAPMTDIDVKINSQGQRAAEINAGKTIKESIKKAVNIVVLKVDNKTEDIWQRIRKMPKPDYEFILKEVDNIVSGKDFTKPISKKEDGTD